MFNALSKSLACECGLADDCVDCQDVSQTVQETYFELPRDLPTAKAALCALAELVTELEDEEQERSVKTLQSRQSIGIGCGCDVFGCECRL